MRFAHVLSIRRTITRDLLIGLTVILTPIMLLRNMIEFRYLSTTMQSTMEKHADESADDMATILQEPLFVMNNDEVKRLSVSFIDAGRVAGIRVTSAANGPLVDRPSSKASLLSPRKRSIRWQGQDLGRVELWFDDSDFTKASTQLVQTLRLISIGVFVFGFSIIYLYLRLALAKPLTGLLQRINEMTAGNLSGELPSVPQQDLNQIMVSMNTMSRALEAATAHLRESNSRYQTLVDNIPLGISLIDADCRIMMSNATMGRWFAKDRDLLIGQHCYREFEKRDQVCGHCPGRVSMATGALAIAESEGVKDDGSRFAVRIRTVPLGTPGNSPGFIEVVEDVTEAKQAEEEKAKVERQLVQAQKMESIGTLAGGIAHDFNNILSAVIGYTDLALLQIKEESPLRNDLVEVRRAGERATTLVKQILTFSRKQQQEKSPLQLSVIVKEALKLLRSTIPTTIEIRQDVLSEGMILADPTQIHQVMMNLCTNAYHAMMERGGNLTVTLKEMAIERTLIDSGTELPPGQYLVLSVSDTGCGMDQETLARIFEPYFTTKDIGKGTGLGLAVVHGIVKDHLGRIAVYSVPGQGTTFKIYLPMIAEGLSVSAPTPSRPPLSTTHERIMVVDDDAAIRDLTREFLTQAGYRVDLFANGAEAWAALSQTPEAWDLLFTDQTMPQMTGDQLAIKARELRADLPVIIASGFSELLDARVQALGVKASLQKPVSVLTLLTAVDKALHGEQETETPA